MPWSWQKISLLTPHFSRHNRQLQHQEAQATAQARVDAGLAQMARHCETINAASKLIERDPGLQDCGRNGSFIAMLLPLQTHLRFFDNSRHLVLPSGYTTSLGCVLQTRPIRLEPRARHFIHNKEGNNRIVHAFQNSARSGSIAF